MKNSFLKTISIGVVSALLMIASYANAQVNYPYTSGQAVFVQSPYNSSLYTNYDYNSRQGAINRLPAYTTNQAVFVQRPYMSQQTVASYPSNDRYNLPRTESRYTSPTAFPTTVAPAYPYGTTSSYISGRYTTTTQTPTYNYPYPTSSYTSTLNYPYTTTTPTTTYPSTTVQQGPASYYPGSQLSPTGYQAAGYNAYKSNYAQPTTTALQRPANAPSAIYNDAYPVTTVSQYPYPTSTTAAPETIIQPAPPPKPNR
ncbi:Conserved putative secreted protein [Candidatus Protochlamydia naegleriophila]|uniref:Conserved putative secreted protein n=1 Tax=Candidatus Protochlamydia naegleriophila TaxID=389348 RepID=A0A0U5ES74_9BACT|nr:hypothetical protein [Candidatus Protochlamydia naegleriophila]CUI17059.1 Conserved putative secreted protein [Candidatus Protochlamydia naegleriophila]